ncbi:MAG: hypothetical protein JKX97_07070 [Candidatus Lindowbacteria bacterium]|nr:hypothetical protein [Candidatus Lindowbacteria bacterium]
MNTLRWAMFGLPGLGSHVLNTSLDNDQGPAIVVHSVSDDFAEFDGERISSQDPDLRKKLDDAGIDCIVVAGWSSKIQTSDYSGFSKGAWNLHPSLLPKYRGHNPYFWVIKNGEKETGITAHQLSDEFDKGPILLQKSIPIRDNETIGSIWNRLSILAGEVSKDLLERIATGDTSCTAQSEGKHIRASKVADGNMILTPSFSREEARRLIQASNPFYGAILLYDHLILKIYEADESGPGPEIPCTDGSLFATVVRDDNIGIVTGETFMKLQNANTFSQ